MGIYPNVWGPSQWLTLHTMALTYPESPTAERQQQMRDYLNGMAANLPCPGCSAHCTQYFTQHPPKVGSAQELSEYLIDFHNEVNTRLGKQVYTYKEANQALLEKVLNVQALTELSRADQIRREDSATIKKLQEKLQKAKREPNLNYVPWCFAGVLLLLLVGLSLNAAIVRRLRHRVEY